MVPGGGYLQHAFSIDLEDWFHGIELPITEYKSYEYRVEKGVDVILELLNARTARCTFFSLGCIAENHPELIKKIAQEGHELALHGLNHQKVYDLTKRDFREELKKAKQLIEDIIGKKVIGYRAPYFSITEDSLWALEVLKEMDFEYDCSISPVKTWRYGISASPDYIYIIKELDLIEFPVSTVQFLGRKIGVGGAYFRIFPFFLFQNFFRNRNIKNMPAMFYAHPWEFDPGHPIVNINWKAKTTHYFNLKSMSKRTEKLLNTFSFTNVSEVIDTYQNYEQLKSISLEKLLC
jgi:polysaccharide deacetylase family protein (PEP-CTERM system associated)